MYEFHYDYIKDKNGNNSRLFNSRLFLIIQDCTDTDKLIYEIKTKHVCEDFSSDKETFDPSNYSTKSKYYDNPNKLVIGKIKNETPGVGPKESVGLKPWNYSFWIEDNSEHKKSKAMNRHVVAVISHHQYKDVMLNNESLRHSINRIQSKGHRKGTYKTNKVSLSCWNILIQRLDIVEKSLWISLVIWHKKLCMKT